MSEQTEENEAEGNEAEGNEAVAVGADSGAAGTPADYESATARLDEIITRLDSGDAQLRETLDLCAEAKTLIQYCATELAAVDEGLKELRLEDLASSLKPAGAPSQTVVSPPAEVTPEALVEPTGSAPAAPGTVTDEQPPPPEEPPF